MIGALTAITSIFRIVMQTLQRWRESTARNGISIDRKYDKARARANWTKLTERATDAFSATTKAKLGRTVPIQVVCGGQVDRESLSDLGVLSQKTAEGASACSSASFQQVQALRSHTDLNNSTEEGSDYCNAAKQFVYLHEICYDQDKGCCRYMRTGYALVTTTAYDKHMVSCFMGKKKWMMPLVDKAVADSDRYSAKQLDLLKIFDNEVGVPVPMVIDKCGMYSGMASVVVECNNKFPLCYEQVIEFGIAIIAVNSPSRWATVVRDWIREGHLLKRHVLLEYVDWTRVRYGTVAPRSISRCRSFVCTRKQEKF
jgi:hypothetical protein